jgi:hypothetical protein
MPPGLPAAAMAAMSRPGLRAPCALFSLAERVDAVIQSSRRSAPVAGLRHTRRPGLRREGATVGRLATGDADLPSFAWSNLFLQKESLSDTD